MRAHGIRGISSPLTSDRVQARPWHGLCGVKAKLRVQILRDRTRGAVKQDAPCVPLAVERLVQDQAKSDLMLSIDDAEAAAG